MTTESTTETETVSESDTESHTATADVEVSDMETILKVEDLKQYFDQSDSLLDTLLNRDQDPIQAVDGVNFSLEKNEVKGVIGESGCGKSTLLLTLMGLHDPTDGRIEFDGSEVGSFSRSDWKEFRSRVQIIFQDPFNSLDPKLPVREALIEPLRVHNRDDKDHRINKVLRKVELSPPENYLDQFPDQLSGGELQRVSIARALVLEPNIILADEPVSMLDVSTQSAILQLLSDLVDESGVSMIYVSHDISTVSYICDEINVMYLGRIIESGPTGRILQEPKHPYTQALIGAVPIPDPHTNRERTELEGSPSDPVGVGEGCRFRDRCPERMDVCEHTPRFVGTEDHPGHNVACHLYYDHNEQADEHTSYDANKDTEASQAGSDESWHSGEE
jgi:peptide/nickel transport system ATP-binding protein